jgi:hypothetical protein
MQAHVHATHACMHECMHVKCSPEMFRGDSMWYMVIEWVAVAYRSQVSLSVTSLGVLLEFDTLLFSTEVSSLHTQDKRTELIIVDSCRCF